jgi:hypothetical protein
MAQIRVQLDQDQQRIVNEERSSHPNPRIRERMLDLWLLQHGVKRHDAAEIVGVSRATVQRYLAAFRDGGLDGLRRWNPDTTLARHLRLRYLFGMRPLARPALEIGHVRLA